MGDQFEAITESRKISPSYYKVNAILQRILLKCCLLRIPTTSALQNHFRSLPGGDLVKIYKYKGRVSQLIWVEIHWHAATLSPTLEVTLHIDMTIRCHPYRESPLICMIEDTWVCH